MDYPLLSSRLMPYIESFFAQHRNPKLVYHNKAHTEEVAAAATLMANHYNLNNRDRFIVQTAAWFHDLGYFISPADHEKRGAELAEAFLMENKVPEEDILEVKRCIMATRMPQQPNGLLEKIVCDADLFHLGKPGLGEKGKQMRKEYELTNNTHIEKNTWNQRTIGLMNSHEFHTDFAQKNLSAQKRINLEKLLEKTSLPAQLPKTLTKTERPERGIETMFRISSNNHQRLSDMADNKAHIMITTTSIIISVLLSVLLRRLEEYPHLTIPAIILLLICLVTMVFSILATRPTIPSGIFTEDDIKEKKVNLLFFGNFYKMNLDEYSNGMHEVMNDREFLYGSLIRDIYSQGVILGRKYKLLRVAYNVFMFGIVISVLAFVGAAIFTTYLAH